MTFTHDLELIYLCDYIWERSGKIPDVREVAMMDQAYMRDLMNFDLVKAYIRTKRNKKRR